MTSLIESKEFVELESFLKDHKEDKIVPSLSPKVKQTLWYDIKRLLQQPQKIKYIVVGDNPGETEYYGPRNHKKEKEKIREQGYFIGPQTKYIRKNFIEKWGDQVLALNKTLFFTETTDKLKNILNAEGENNTPTSQEIMANLIVALAKSNPDVHIWIVGHGHFVEKAKLNCYHSSKDFPKDKFFGPFQKTINEALDSSLKKRIFVFGHPSRSWFKKDIEKALKGKVLELTDENIQAIEKIGEERANKYF